MLGFLARSIVTIPIELTRLQFLVPLTTLPVNRCVYNSVIVNKLEGI